MGQAGTYLQRLASTLRRQIEAMGHEMNAIGEKGTDFKRALDQEIAKMSNETLGKIIGDADLNRIYIPRGPISGRKLLESIASDIISELLWILAGWTSACD